MFRILFLFPIVLCVAWYLFLRRNRVPIKQGKKGFVYILIASVFVLGFFLLMIKVTQH